jgi:hypothetical protein
MIVCGWCGRATPDGPRCAVCRHVDPTRPYAQRGLDVPTAPVHDAGRPPRDPAEVGRRLANATRILTDGGRDVTVEALAEVLDVSARTVRRWREMAV